MIDVGAGPGLDTALWAADGFAVVGARPHPRQRRPHARSRADGRHRLAYDLPFRSESFDAIWTMSTFVHVPHDRFDEAITEMLRVVEPGAPIGVGTWGGLDFEGVPEFGELRPYRFFSLASHGRWRTMLARHAEVELFETYESTGGHGWDYQFAVVRRKRSNSSGVRMPRSSTAV